MTRIAWLQAALEDLRSIHDYIARDNPAVVHSSHRWPEQLP